MGVSDDHLVRQEEDRTRRGVEDRKRWSDRAINEEPVLGHRGRVRLAWIAVLLVVVALAATLPPLLNVNRYQKRVASAIADSIGRPVHFDSITMHLLPLPGFTIQNFVVMEDPAFGAEPAMRANVVQARVRVSSLWRRRVEISRIRLEAPSVNLVRRPDGAWNLQGVVTQAGHLQSAPTAQRVASATPRFPYIEATGARVNLKLGDNKLPYSLVDTEFSLWLPNAQEWHLRLQGRPLRTDTNVSDVGELRVEATLGRGAGAGGAANEPLTLDASWKPTPMGEAAKLITGNESDWRGAASAELSLHGTPSAMNVVSDLHLHNLRRADFVPRLPMGVDAHCEANAAGVLHQLSHVRCVMPTARSTSLLDAVNFFRKGNDTPAGAPGVLSLQAEVPNAMDLHSAVATVDLQKGSPEWVLGWMRLFSRRISPELAVGGDLALHLHRDPETEGEDDWTGSAICRCTLPSLIEDPRPRKPAESRPAEIAAASAATSPWLLQASHDPSSQPGSANAVSIRAFPKPAPIPARTGPDTQPDTQPETASVEPVDPAHSISGQISRSGYTLQYGSAAIARYAAGLLPTLGDEMPTTLSGVVQSERAWGARQVWTEASSAPVRAPRRMSRGHRR